MKMFPGTNPVFIVVLPLVVLIEERKQEASKLWIIDMQIGVHNSQKYKDNGN